MLPKFTNVLHSHADREMFEDAPGNAHDGTNKGQWVERIEDPVIFFLHERFEIWDQRPLAGLPVTAPERADVRQEIKHSQIVGIAPRGPDALIPLMPVGNQR